MRKKTVICIGASLIDECFTSIEEPIRGTSNPSTFFRSSGGVACNIANHLSLLGVNVELITHFGNDEDGKWLMDRCKKNGIGISNSILNDLNTGRYSAHLTPDGELFSAAMTSHLETEITIDFLAKKISLLTSAALLQIDCNLSEDCLKWIIDFSRKENIPCIIEPVSIPKAKRLEKLSLQNVLLITPNKDEMLAMSNQNENGKEEILIKNILSRGAKNLWIRNGKNGSRIFTIDSMLELDAPKVNVIDSTGAGDAALAGWIYAWLQNKTPYESLLYGHSMASIILQVKGAVQNNLSEQLLEKTVENYFNI